MGEIRENREKERDVLHCSSSKVGPMSDSKSSFFRLRETDESNKASWICISLSDSASDEPKRTESLESPSVIGNGGIDRRQPRPKGEEERMVHERHKRKREKRRRFPRIFLKKKPETKRKGMR